MKNPRIALSIALVAILAIGGVLLFVPKARPGTTTPPIVWMPDHIVVTLAPGETTAFQATAIIKNNIPPTVAQFVPPLAPYVSLSPSSSPALSKGSQRQFEVLVSVPLDAPPATIEGTLHLRAGAATVARPLPIVLNIVWPMTDVPGTQLHVRYPPSMTPTVYNNPDPVGGVQIISFSGNGVGFSIEVSKTELGDATIEEWADAGEWPFPDSWRNHYSLRQVAGHTALQSLLSRSVIFKNGSDVYYIMNGLGWVDKGLLDEGTLEAILASIEFN